MKKVFFSSRKNFFLVHHIFMKNLTKLGLGHVKTFLRSFWAISIDMQNPYGNELWVEKYIFLTKMIVSAEYSTNVEIFTWKYFFQKVWIMGYIFHISHAWKYSKPTELHYFKVTLQNTFFKGFYFKKPTVRVYGYDSNEPWFSFGYVSKSKTTYSNLLPIAAPLYLRIMCKSFPQT